MAGDSEAALDNIYTTEQQRQRLEAEFATHVYLDVGLANRAFKGIVNDKGIKSFLKKSPLYNNKAKLWGAVAISPSSKLNLYAALAEIFTSIIRYFGLSKMYTVVGTHLSPSTDTEKDTPEKPDSADDTNGLRVS